MVFIFSKLERFVRYSYKHRIIPYIIKKKSEAEDEDEQQKLKIWRKGIHIVTIRSRIQNFKKIKNWIIKNYFIILSTTFEYNCLSSTLIRMPVFK